MTSRDTSINFHSLWDIPKCSSECIKDLSKFVTRLHPCMHACISHDSQISSMSLSVMIDNQFKQADDLLFTMSSKYYKANGYMHDLDLLIILHYCVFHILHEMGAK